MGDFLGQVWARLEGFGQEFGRHVGPLAGDARKIIDNFGQDVGGHVGAIVEHAQELFREFGQHADKPFEDIANIIREALEHSGASPGQPILITVQGINESFSKVAEDVHAQADYSPESIIEQIGLELQKAFQEVLKHVQLMGNYTERASERLNGIDYIALAQNLLQWIRQHPAQTTFILAGSLAMVAPAIITGPLYHFLGLTPIGPAADSYARGFQVAVGNVPERGVFATFQSAAMHGYGAPIIADTVQVAGVLIVAIAVWGLLGNSVVVTDGVTEQALMPPQGAMP